MAEQKGGWLASFCNDVKLYGSKDKVVAGKKKNQTKKTRGVNGDDQ